MRNLNLNLSLSSIFYLIPLYFLVIAPLLRQLDFVPSTPFNNAHTNSLDDLDDLDDIDTSQTLNPDVLSLDDGIPLTCPAESPSDTYKIHILSSHSPLVIYIEDFLSQSESAHLVNISLPNYTPSTLYSSSLDSETPETPNIDQTKRLSDRALLPRDTTVRCIEARARAFQGWKPHLYIERMWAQRYNVSGHYTHHYDWAGTARGRGGDRFSTFMVYLKSEGVVGGGTNFPYLRMPRDRKWCEFVECAEDEGEEEGSSEGGGQKGRARARARAGTQGVTFKPIQGNAVFWENLRSDGSGWPETLHAAFPVEEGEKVGLNIWSWYQPPEGRWM
ncbi:hypothetical protein BJX99DRAFT_222771 [Aspergillus californicus]